MDPDATTLAVLADPWFALGGVPLRGTRIRVRRPENLHTGGTTEGVTARLRPEVAAAAGCIAPARQAGAQPPHRAPSGAVPGG